MADVWDAVNAGLNFYSSSRANKKSEENIKDGFQQQNAWAQYQPEFAKGLMALLQNPGMITQTPGYQFAYDQGLQGMFAKQASTGNRFSGRALEETMRYGQGLASQMYNDEMSRYMTLSGATQGVTGGTAMGQDLSSINQQQSYNQGYFMNTLFDNLRGNGTSVTAQGTSNPYDNSVNGWTNTVGR